MAPTISMILIKFLQPLCQNIKNNKNIPDKLCTEYCVSDENIVKISENIGKTFSRKSLSERIGNLQSLYRFAFHKSDSKEILMFYEP